MIGFGILTLIYYAAILAAWIVALIGGMFLWRAGLRQPFGKNPGYVTLSGAAALGLVAALANPSVYLGFGSTARAVFFGFIGALVGIAIVAVIGYLLTPERLDNYYALIQRRLEGSMTPESQSGSSSGPGVSANDPGTMAASEEHNLDGSVKSSDNQDLQHRSEQRAGE